MRIAIASGKGGTGKTTVTASLADLWPGDLIAVDLDVEEPNLHLFLNPELPHTRPAVVEVPKVDEAACTHCGACAELCQFKAISVFGEIVMTFPEMCHGCGGCQAVCPANAITWETRHLGDVRWGRVGKQRYLMGALRVGEAMSPPLMRAVKRQLNRMLDEQAADVLIDAPPGVSCPAVNAVMDSDLIVLVTEPTPFGLYDLTLAHQAFSVLKIPMAVVVNRAGVGDLAVYAYCEANRLPVLAQIPYARDIAQTYARGKIVATLNPETHDLFADLVHRIRCLTPAAAEVGHA